MIVELLFLVGRQCPRKSGHEVNVVYILKNKFTQRFLKNPFFVVFKSANHTEMDDL